ncbi:S8 family peptidase [Cellulomonas sp. NS3]|uniref:S8 family peptidase n=1 Tax=Cellulomonas sp. NS3 TaxID=2973977 RepID=UPI002163FE35|nr:S8/S53 family peptidase [Cellulomonas sp. NS3]
MSEQTPRRATATPSATADLLVAAEHDGLVRTTLDRWGATGYAYESDEALGLSRLAFPREHLEGLLDGWRERPQDSGPDDVQDDATVPRLDPGYARPLRRAVDGGLEPDHADELLTLLRASFRDRYSGWFPTMGKNRFVGLVTNGGGTVSHGGGPPPERTDQPVRFGGRGGAGIRVGVLDTAVSPHPALAGRFLADPPDDLVAGDGPFPVAAGHATFVTGLVLHRAPGATVRVRRVLDDRGAASSWDVARGIVALGRSGIDVLNLSLVCYTSDSRPPLALATAVDRLPPEVLVVACAGNHADPVVAQQVGGTGPDGALRVDAREPAWPAALDDVVAVGSARARESKKKKTRSATLTAFTPPDSPWIDVVVPGEGLLSTYLTGPVELDDGTVQEFSGQGRWGGTSFSAALLTGQVARRAAKQGVPVREAWSSLVAGAAAADGDGYVPPFVDVPL